MSGLLPLAYGIGGTDEWMAPMALTLGYGILFARLVSKGDLTMLTLLWRFLTIYVGVFIGLFIIYRELFSRRREMRQ